MPNRAVTTMVFALMSALALASCGKKIGDSCQTRRGLRSEWRAHL